MKTTDEVEITSLHGSYYLDNGEVVCLEDVCENLKGKTKYWVIPLFEGETMEASGAGGEHHEISMYYEHEGATILVDKIYSKCPMEKVDAKYKKAKDDIENATIGLGVLVKRGIKLENENIILENTNKNLLNIHRNTKDAIELYKKEKEALKNTIIDQKRESQELDDSIHSMTAKDRDVEIGRLEKDSVLLQCIRNAGVDNWDGYEYAIKEFQEVYPEA